MSDPGPNDNTGAPLIEIEGLTKRFGAFTAVDNVSFTVSRGEVVGFSSWNGAGKSTTMRMLAGFMIPSEGIARIMGHDVQTDGVAARRMLGFLPEGAPTYGEMSVTGFLRSVRIRGYHGAALHDRVVYAIGLTRSGKRPPATGRDIVERLQTPRRSGTGTAARSAGAGAGRADRRARPQPET